MKYKISALIIDPNHEKHNYNNIKSLKFGEYAEDNFVLKILKSDKNILTEIYNFNYFDSIITIGKKEADFKELFNLPFKYRKKWCHIQNFDEKIISNCIINTFKYKINIKNKPTIFSFFTCTYKTEKHKLERLYNSLVNQLYKEWNWFIIDDSPNNDTIDIINSFKDPRITVIKNITHHGNIGFNKHTIAMMCDGDYLIEIDHDDEVTPDCLLYLKNAFEKYPDAKFAYSLCVEYSVNNENKTPIVYRDGWGWGEGINKTDFINGENIIFSTAPNINPYSIRTIYAQPNHLRCWEKQFYHEINGHNTDLSVLDDMELLIRTFLNTRMIKINKVLYFQYEDAGERGSKDNTNTQSARFAEIQRTVWLLKDKYDLEIHNRIIELGFKDDPWNDENKTSILWKKHIPNQEIMNYIYEP